MVLIIHSLISIHFRDKIILHRSSTRENFEIVFSSHISCSTERQNMQNTFKVNVVNVLRNDVRINIVINRLYKYIAEQFPQSYCGNKLYHHSMEQFGMGTSHIRIEPIHNIKYSTVQYKVRIKLYKFIPTQTFD